MGRHAPLLLVAAAALLAACDPPAVCGDGVVQAGEDELTCCVDVGCAFGVCEGAAGCLDPWTLSCEGGGGGGGGGGQACLAEGPWRCQEAASPAYEAEVEGRLADEGLTAAVVFAERAHRAICAHDELFPSCALPFVADCAQRAGRPPLVALVVDMDAVADDIDRVLLRRASNRIEAEVLFFLDQSIRVWRGFFEDLATPERFRVDVGARELVVRAQVDEDYGEVWWLAVPARGRSPWGLLGYRVLWADAQARAHLLEHDLWGRSCSWTLDVKLTFTCTNPSGQLVAVMDPTTLALESLSTSP
jgi:hypothetical protein